MNKREIKSIMIALIRDALVNHRLVGILNEAGLIADMYCLDLPEIIIRMIMQPNSRNFDEMFEKFEEIAEEALSIDISSGRGNLDLLANKLYQELLFKAKSIKN